MEKKRERWKPNLIASGSEIFNETFPFGLADFHFGYKSPMPSRKRLEN